MLSISTTRPSSIALARLHEIAVLFVHENFSLIKTHCLGVAHRPSKLNFGDHFGGGHFVLRFGYLSHDACKARDIIDRRWTL